MACNFLLGIAASAHIGLSGDYNNFHPQARVECNNYISGAYLNSVENVSVYAGLQSKFTENFKIEYGIVDGYSQHYNKDIIPFVRVVYRNFFISPTFEIGESGNNKSGIVFGVEFNVGD